MRHLHFTQSLEPLNGGGLGSSSVALHRQMRARGLSSVLCSTHGGSPQRLADHTVEFRRLKPDAVYYAPALQWEASRLVREADVIHGHGLYVGTNFVLGRQARKQGKALIYHVHGMFEPYILQRSRWKKRLVHWLFEDENFRRVRLWRALTGKEADQIRACGIRRPIVIVPNGLDLDEYPLAKSAQNPIRTPWVEHLEKTGRRVLFLGRIHPKKGLDLLLPAWAKLGSLRSGWELVIAGPDEQGYLARVREMARSLGLQEQIVFTGPVSGETKLSLLNSSELFVLPSHSEGFPMTILEAMACGVPVVATHACNFPDISTADAGWECAPTPDSVMEALTLAMQASELELLQRGRNGRTLVETRYSWAPIIRDLVSACAQSC